MSELDITQQIARHMAAFNIQWSIEWSPYTGLFWTNAPIHIGDGTFLHGITEHAMTPESALVKFFARLREVDSPNFLVTNDTDKDKRKHWRWNGVCFQEVSRG